VQLLQGFVPVSTKISNERSGSSFKLTFVFGVSVLNKQTNAFFEWKESLFIEFENDLDRVHLRRALDSFTLGECRGAPFDLTLVIS
jgi:hypothetical protein